MCKSLVEQVKVKENFNTSLLSNDDNKKDNIFDTYDISEISKIHEIGRIQYD